MNRAAVMFWAAAAAFVLAAAPIGCSTTMEDQSTVMEQAAASRSPLTGQPAPGFTLMAHNELQVSLNEYTGRWVVLYFYPRDDTPGCTCQATEFTKLLSDFSRLNTVVLGVSPDSTYSHRRFKDKYDIQITLLSDPDHQVAKQYGAWGAMGRDKDLGRMIRGTVVVDPHGVIAHHWPEVIPQGHAARVRDKLKQLMRDSPKTLASPTH